MQRVIRPAWLLRQADELGYRAAGPGQPRNTNLRRAVSAAYYAVFHAVGWGVARHLLPSAPESERAALTRSVEHRAVRDVCSWITARGPAPTHARVPVGVTRADVDLVDAAEAFIELREQRHAADYDHLANFSTVQVLNLVDLAHAAVSTIEHGQSAAAPSAQRFFALVALASRIR